MDPKHRRIILQNKEYLKNKIDMVTLKTPLQQSNIFTMAMLADIGDDTNNLLDELPLRGPTAFLKFVQVLKETKDVGNTAAAVRLEKLHYCDPDVINRNSWTNGCCLIINNGKLMMSKSMQSQANVESDALKDAFKSVWKSTEIFNSKSKEEILKILNTFIKKDFSKITVCVVVILSRGTVEQNQGIIYGTDGQYILESEIFNMFCSGSEDLSNTPKLFLFPYNFTEDASDEKLIKVPNFTGIHLIRWPSKIKTEKLFGESLAECFSNCFASCNLENIDLNEIVKNAYKDFNANS